MGKMRIDWMDELEKIIRTAEALLLSIEKYGELVDEGLAKEAWTEGTEFLAALFKLDQEIAKRRERGGIQPPLFG